MTGALAGGWKGLVPLINVTLRQAQGEGFFLRRHALTPKPTPLTLSLSKGDGGRRHLQSGLLAAFLTLLLSAGAANAQAPAWTVEDGSRVGFIAKQASAEVQGFFEAFTAEIAFAPDDLAGSRVAVTIETASVNSESKDRDDLIKAPDLFNVATWPTARFEAANFVDKGGDAYEASGTLTLRDQTRDVVLPFTLTIAPHPEKAGALQAEAKGELAILRLDYGVGQGLWQDTSQVANEVRIFIDLRATRPME